MWAWFQKASEAWAGLVPAAWQSGGSWSEVPACFQCCKKQGRKKWKRNAKRRAQIPAQLLPSLRGKVPGISVIVAVPVPTTAEIPAGTASVQPRDTAPGQPTRTDTGEPCHRELGTASP